MVIDLALRSWRVATLLAVTTLLSSLAVVTFVERADAASISAGQDVLSDPVRPVIYWAGADGDDLKFINSTTGNITDSIVVGTGPTSICLSQDGTTLYVAVPTFNCIIVVDAITHQITANRSLSFSPLSVRLDGKGFVYAGGAGANAGSVFSIDMRTWNVKNSVSPGVGSGLVVEVSPDGGTLLAFQTGTSPTKIYKYGVNAGNFNYLDVDNHDLGDFIKGEKVDWARGQIYLASGAPYGIEVTSVATLDKIGFWQMVAYTSTVAISVDKSFVFGAFDGPFGRELRVFNATDGTLIGGMNLPIAAEHLAVAQDLRSVYIGPPIQRVSLIPTIEYLNPAPDSLLGFSPPYFTLRIGGGLQGIVYNLTPTLDDMTNLTLNPFDYDSIWTYYVSSTINQTLSAGIHNISVSQPFIVGSVWENASFRIDRDSPQSLRPALYPNSPRNGSLLASTLLIVKVNIVYPTVFHIAQGGWMSLDGVLVSSTFDTLSMIAFVNGTPSLGWHNLSATIFWDGGLGKAWTNWSFVYMEGPLLTPIYPATDQVLTDMPDRIEVAVDYRDTGGNVSAPQLFIDYEAVMTTMTSNGTIRGSLYPLSRSGYHDIRATLDWEGGKVILDWQFTLDMFIGPTGEVLAPYKYKEEFSLLVPEGDSWTLEQDSEISGAVYPIVAYGPTFGGFRTNIIVNSAHDSAVEESEKYLYGQLYKSMDELNQSGMAASIFVDPRITTVDNHTAIVAALYLEAFSAYQDFVIIASKEHRMVWIVILSASTSEFGTYSEMFELMVDSFRIELSATSPIRGDALVQEAIGLGIALLAGGIAGAVVWITRRRRGPAEPPGRSS